MKDIEGFHILWTAPYFEKSKDDTYSGRSEEHTSELQSL